MSTKSNELNFDADRIIDALRIAMELDKRFGKERVEMRRSSHKGWHFRVKGRFSKRKIIKIREEIGDDRNRIKADKARVRIGARIGILFYYKNGKYAGKWEKLDLKKVWDWACEKLGV